MIVPPNTHPHRLQVSRNLRDSPAMSLVPEGPSTSLLFVPDLRKTVVLTCYSAKLAHYGIISLVAKWCGFVSYWAAAALCGLLAAIL